MSGPFSVFKPQHPVFSTPAIWHPEASRSGYTVLHFRKTFQLEAVQSMRIWVSAGQRFILKLDEIELGRGPARSDQENWSAVPFDLNLAAGDHTLRATVVHFGSAGGKGQLGGLGFFLLAPDTWEVDLPFSTATPWEVCHDTHVCPQPKRAGGSMRGHFAVGDGEEHAWSGYDQAWGRAKVVAKEAANRWGNRPLDHLLRPEPLPQMTHTARKVGRIRQCTPAELRPAVAAWCSDDAALVIPPQTEARVVLDAGEHVNAYPHLPFSGGAGSVIEWVSCEAPINPESKLKGNRDDLDGKELPGQLDILHPDGAAHTFEPHWFRSFRYVEMTIRTADASLTLDPATLFVTEYPLPTATTVSVTDKTQDWSRLWSVTDRTARLCAHETLFDCPHYEQAQFPGDSRIQARYHYLAGNDDALIRKAIDDMHNSRTSCGLLRSHYPATFYQILPTYSLHWIGMLDEFRMYRGDVSFLKRYLPVARGILEWFVVQLREDGLLGRLPYAPFTDWNNDFDAGRAPEDDDGGSSIVTLMAAQAVHHVATLEGAIGIPSLEPYWRSLAQDLCIAVHTHCWDEGRGLLADTPRKRSFSVHAQVEAVLAGAYTHSEGRKILSTALGMPDATQPGTFYYTAFLCDALLQTGLTQPLSSVLEPWWRLLENSGLTTWPETCAPNPRSDCHAWSILPGIGMVEWLVGLRPDPTTEGFKQALLHPTLHDFKSIDRVEATVETPAGRFVLDWRKHSDGSLQGEVELPVPTWVPALKGQLKPGTHRLTIPPQRRPMDGTGMLATHS